MWSRTHSGLQVTGEGIQWLTVPSVGWQWGLGEACPRGMGSFVLSGLCLRTALPDCSYSPSSKSGGKTEFLSPNCFNKKNHGPDSTSLNWTTSRCLG